MSTTMRDTIEREIVIRATKERVFKAISDPAQIVRWFFDRIEGDIAPGTTPVIEFEGHGKYQIYVEAVDPFDYFAYRWVPGNEYGTLGFLGDVLAHPNTLVEFRLADAPDGTILTLKESGFSTLPAAVAEKQLADNSGGWDYMLARLLEYAPTA